MYIHMSTACDLHFSHSFPLGYFFLNAYRVCCSQICYWRLTTSGNLISGLSSYLVWAAASAGATRVLFKVLSVCLSVCLTVSLFLIVFPLSACGSFWVLLLFGLIKSAKVAAGSPLRICLLRAREWNRNISFFSWRWRWGWDWGWRLELLAFELNSKSLIVIII